MVGLLEGKVALVTGGSSGIGRATALAFAREGAKVVVADVAVESGKRTEQMITEMCRESMFVESDMTKAGQVKTLIEKTVQTYGRLDCAFNNAGIEGERSQTADIVEEEWDRVIRINLKSVWLCMKYEIRQMLTQMSGSIVNASSKSGIVGTRLAAHYVSTKHAVAGLTKTAALEYASRGIRINAVCPGAIITPMTDRLMINNPEEQKRIIAEEPIGRMGTAEELAEAVIWLSSDAASFVIGHTMVVDGGLLAQ